MELSPLFYELTSRTQLEELSPHHVAIVKRIKSRIIQKDAHKIVAMAEQIKAVDPSLTVSLSCNDNICSKSLELLRNNGVEVRF